LLETVLLTSVAEPEYQVKMPPPAMAAVLPETVELSRVAVLVWVSEGG
jgi:hypothetical protein